MQVDWSVELGSDDPTLAIPWNAPDGEARFHDLKAHPDLLLYVTEAQRNEELGQFLAAVNGPRSRFQTAKCDYWITTQRDARDEEFEGEWKFQSYVDVLYDSAGPRSGFEAHEALLKRLCELLKRAPELPSQAEFIVRRCFFARDDEWDEGFYFTFYLTGYGEDEEEARKHWGIALKLVENVLLQVSS